MTTYVFPGQGSQFRGMGQTLFNKYPNEMKKASEILGYDVADLCINDSNRNLNKTQFTQPALYVVNALTYFEYRDLGKPQADFLAGHSLGEYNALLAANAFDFETGLQLVKRRGELIAQCPAGGMAAIIGFSEKEVRAILQSNNLDKIDLANINSPSQIIVSGAFEEIERAKVVFEARGVKRFIELNVSGPFHSRYMNQAREAFLEFLGGFQFNDLSVPVISNLEARPYKSEKIRETLADQINHGVRWCESMCYLWGLGQEEVVELGPGTVLTDLWKFIKKEGQPLVTTDLNTVKSGAGSPSSDGSDENRGNDIPMAIIGMSCRFPGANDYNEFWDNLVNRRSAIFEFIESRHPIQIDSHGPIQGGFIDEADLFDPQYFNLSPKEAKYIDPQHRVFLQTALGSIEDAGYRLVDLSGKRVGVYAGVSRNDYAELMRESHESIEAFVSTGTVHSILANRVSFVLNLKGPSETIDTACASSLHAFYHAFNDLNQGRCDIALVGGVNLNLSKHGFISQEKAGLLASDGMCKTFDAKADGYVRGEGVAVFLMKPLSAAISDRDQILGVVKGVSVNHSGKKQFPEFPSREVQLDLMKTFKSSISHIEVHGASTLAGDANEFEGLKEVFRTHQSAGGAPRKCSLGSVKPNIGNLESASGLGSLVKILMAMKHNQIPPNLYPSQLNPSIQLEGSPFFIPTESYDWKTQSGTPEPRTAVISVFGLGGSNACLFVEEPPTSPIAPASKQEDLIFVFSAKKGRLKPLLEDFVSYLTWVKDDSISVSLHDISYTLQVGRDEHEERLASVAKTQEELLQSLFSFLREGKTGRRVFAGSAQKTDELIQKRDLSLEAIAEAWVKGSQVKWGLFQKGNQAQRVPLPTYPFEKRRCWFGTPSTLEKPKLFQVLNKDQFENKASISLQLEPGQYFVADHVVQNECILPGVGYLELARQTAELLGTSVNEVKDIYWMQPLKVLKPRSVVVKMTTHPMSISFEVRDDAQVYCKGILSSSKVSHLTTTEPMVDIHILRSRLPEKKGQTALYEGFRSYGLKYGENFRVIHEIYLNQNEALATLNPLPKNMSTFEDGILEPSILDGVFQTAVALSQKGEGGSDQWVPFHCNEVQILKVGKPAYGYARLIKKVQDLMLFDLALLDLSGETLVKFSGFSKRRYSQKKPLTYYDVRWNQQDPIGPTQAVSSIVTVNWGKEFRKIGSHSYELGKISPDIRALVDELKLNSQDTIELAFLWNWKGQSLLWNSSEFCERFLDEVFQRYLWLAQGLIRSDKQVKWAHVYDTRDPAELPFHASIGGFFRTLMFENPGFFCCTIGTDNLSENSVEQVSQEFSSEKSKLGEVRYIEGERYFREVTLLNKMPSDSRSVLKERGTYLITGGAGGLGFIFSKYLAEKFKARLIWIGRREVNEEINNKITSIRDSGGEATYWRADVTQRDSLCSALEEALKNGVCLDGVIHGSGVIKDAFILLKDYPTFQSIYRTKVLGAIHLDELTQKMDLDFFCLFSSIAALIPNQGQSDYSSGNSFLDEFAFERNKRVSQGQRKGKTIALNWPLWAEGGLQVTPEEVEHLYKFFGMHPMGTQEGIQAFEFSLMRDLTSDVSQLVPVPGKEQKMAEHLLESSKPNSVGKASSVKKVGSTSKSAGISKDDLISLFSEVLGISKSGINTKMHFNDMQVNSLAIARLTGEIKKKLGVDVKPTLFFEVTNIDELAKHFHGKKADPAISSDVAQQKLRSLIDSELEVGRVYSKTWDNSEFYMIDHVVGGLYNVPGACFIEMARQAGELADSSRPVLELTDNYWAKQLSSGGEKLTAWVKLSPGRDRTSYEIVSHSTGVEQVHSSGSIVYGNSNPPPSQALEIIRQRLPHQWVPEKIYESIIDEGLHVGPTFMPMTRISLGETEALGELSLPEAVFDTYEEYVLHPSLLTGVFQTALISNRFYKREPELQFIPMSIGSIRVYHPIPKRCYVYAKADQDTLNNPKIRKFNLDILDQDGKICVTLKDFAIRSLVRAKTDQKPVVQEASKVRVKETAESQTVRGIDQANVEEFLKSLVASTLEMNSNDIEAQVKFEKYGINSVMIMQLNRVLESSFGPLSKTLFFEYSNISELATYFLKKHKEKLRSLIQADGNSP